MPLFSLCNLGAFSLFFSWRICILQSNFLFSGEVYHTRRTPRRHLSLSWKAALYSNTTLGLSVCAHQNKTNVTPGVKKPFFNLMALLVAPALQQNWAYMGLSKAAFGLKMLIKTSRIWYDSKSKLISPQTLSSHFTLLRKNQAASQVSKVRSDLHWK